jgi:hypothetical protein
MAWQPPTITVKWGPYFAADPAEQQQITKMVVEVGDLIPLRNRVEKLAPIFGIENVEAALKDVEKEREENAQRELDAATAAISKAGGAGGAGKNPSGAGAASGSGGGRPEGGKNNAR